MAAEAAALCGADTHPLAAGAIEFRTISGGLIRRRRRRVQLQQEQQQLDDDTTQSMPPPPIQHTQLAIEREPHAGRV
ncbi:unnamed protein product [Heligmosomoides polygyrus]|uniref:Uncharacterized protein n=1 Tax=Heligmosomoides polygyrus TaxID=6339 RepID=A0A183FG85_HELPZ|nr:unnamed protein product [Heligmosomoides polygyrus]